MAVHLVFPLATLVDESELEQRPDIRPLAGQRDEHGDVGGVVLRVLAVRVEVDGPLKPADGEGVAGDVFAYAHSLRQRVPLDDELVGPIHSLGDGSGDRGRGDREVLLGDDDFGYHWRLKSIIIRVMGIGVGGF